MRPDLSTQLQPSIHFHIKLMRILTEFHIHLRERDSLPQLRPNTSEMRTTTSHTSQRDAMTTSANNTILTQPNHHPRLFQDGITPQSLHKSRVSPNLSLRKMSQDQRMSRLSSGELFQILEKEMRLFSQENLMLRTERNSMAGLTHSDGLMMEMMMRKLSSNLNLS